MTNNSDNVISMDKQYTCNGEPVRLLCTDGPGTYPVVGIVANQVFFWTKKGLYFTHGLPADLNLTEVTPKIKVERWVNIVKRGTNYCTYFYSTKEDAVNNASSSGLLALAVPFVWEGENV